jgi:hypothetical protein
MARYDAGTTARAVVVPMTTAPTDEHADRIVGRLLMSALL